MDRNAPISDATITKNAVRELSGRGLRSPCRIQVQTRNGEVTLSGTVQFVHQRDAAIQAIRTVEGIKRVVEKLKVTPPAKHQYNQPTRTDAPTVKVAGPSIAAANPLDNASTEEDSAPGTLPADDQQAPAASESTDFSVAHLEVKQARPEAGMHHTRKGEDYVFECASQEEAEQLRVLLASYADWLKRNSWIGESKANGSVHRVTFHAKSVIDFLRQAGF